MGTVLQWTLVVIAFEMSATAIARYSVKNEITKYPYIEDCLFILESHTTLVKFSSAKALVSEVG